MCSMRSIAIAAAAAVVSWALQAQPVLWPPEREPSAAERQAVADLAKRAEALDARLRPWEAKRADLSDLAAYVNVPLARLKWRKANLLLRRSSAALYRSAIERDLAEGEEILAGATGKPWHVGRSGLLELAYVTANDGTTQPYYIHIPKNYTADRAWPLIVFLHGWVPSITICDPWVLSSPELDLAAKQGFLVLIPYGRRNTDFQGVGEVDVLAATEEAQKLYRVDPDRIYLMGVSMGGMGTWDIGLRYPHKWAALAPISGQTDMFIWWQWPREQTPAFKRFLVEWDNAVDIAPNGFSIPIFLQHGEFDHLISVEQSHLMLKTARKWGYEVKFHEFKGESHYIYWDLPCYRNAFAFFKPLSLNRRPRHIKYKTYSLRYDRAYWARIAEITNYGRPAYLEAEVTGPGQVQVKTDNVGAFALTLDRELLGPGQQAQISINGEAPRQTAVPKEGETLFRVQGEPPAGLHKKKTLCGPCEDAMNYPFLCVKGTQGTEADRRRVGEMFDRWVKDWDAFADGFPRQKDDTQVTKEDVARYNLILFGEPSTNRIIARIAARLPIKIEDHKYQLNGKTYAGDDLGLVMIYPNPENPEKYVLIYAGELYGRKCGINHKHDLLPDFLIFKADEFFDHDDTNKYVLGGFFDRNWQIDPSGVFCEAN